VGTGGGQLTDAPAEQAVVRLGTAARAWRAAVVAALTAMFLAGSLVGQDSWWPFSPWRMFSTSQEATGTVKAMALQVQTEDDTTWTPTPITPSSAGLNRAEVEGRSGQIVGDPSMLGTLARSHARLRPDEPRWVAVRLVREETVVVDRRPTGEVRTTELARWAAP
jgi:hypothetical protein